jgi:hypothetical protein
VSATTSRKPSDVFIRSVEDLLSSDICRNFLCFQNAARARRPWFQGVLRYEAIMQSNHCIST